MALTFDDTQAATLLDLLGLPADTTDVETILATVKDAVTASTADGAQPSAVAAAAKRVGMELLDTDTAASLRAEAAEGRQIKAAAVCQKIEASVGDAIAKGKITPARRKHWIDLITADPGMADVLASVPNETAVPMTEIGHGMDSDGAPGQPNDAWFY
ncbi:Mu-like prophage I protein [Mycolicibacterium chubuense NBB4]|uniref:Mu-like prophage I protein n=1 Tax=Mycolicibacterium chubuense (strain NBB4) TaxID=710421 RepID=I4BI86_MYCCN|nr:phage protease [Mycolicibacterium chubuense]AFM16993.1 Mu-like prophage I protein [Mycolicibacterium chubuense NBB4]